MALSECSLPRLALAALLAIALASGLAIAETYKITDEKGRVQYTDRVPPDAVNRGMVELNKQGMAKNVTAPSLTPEQRKNEEHKLERQREADHAAMRQRAQEKALLASYTAESDIDVAKRRNLAIIGAAIISAEARIKSLERRAGALEKEKQYYDNKPIPDKLRRESTSIELEIPKQHELIASKKQEALAIEQKYNQQKERFRELKSQLARESAPPRLQ